MTAQNDRKWQQASKKIKFEFKLKICLILVHDDDESLVSGGEKIDEDVSMEGRRRREKGACAVIQIQPVAESG